MKGEKVYVVYQLVYDESILKLFEKEEDAIAFYKEEVKREGMDDMGTEAHDGSNGIDFMKIFEAKIN
jgi:hypothetical protein